MNGVRSGNLFEDAFPPPAGERFDELWRSASGGGQAGRGAVVVERIVSSAAPEPASYDQPQDEWVVLLAGEAALDVDGQQVELRPGDYLLLPAHTPHRVLRTSRGALWLAIHVHPERCRIGPHTAGRGRA